jgi:hypothetical protein
MHVLFQSGIDCTNCLLNCSNNGNCLFKKDTLVCNCNSNFTGSTCQTNLHPCSSFPCLNNGTCSDNVSSQTYTCQCNTELYNGANCEKAVDFCANYSCSGNGYCQKVNNQPVCSCFYGSSGTNCSTVSLQTQLVRAVISTSTIIAICFIIGFYALMIAMDLDKFYRDFI